MSGVHRCLDEDEVLELLHGRGAARIAELDACAECRRLVAALMAEEDRSTRRAGAAFADSLAEGTRLAQRYRVIRQLGQGGMGVVYEVEDELLGVRVALKLLVGRSHDRRERVRRELLAARRVSHPYVCRVHDVGLHGELTFLTMELVRGETLEAHLRRGIFAEHARAWLEQIATGLDAMHQVGLVHRDLKPANVMIDDAHVARVMDLGLARDLARDPVESGMWIGTPAFWAPEQAGGHRATPRSDLYSLGLVARAVLDAAPPFRGAERTRDVVAAMLAQDPAERPASARVLVDALASEVPGGGARLPFETEPLFGREDEIDHVTRALEHDRLVTILAPGGFGKTRVALASAHRAAARGAFRGGVFFCEVSDATPDATGLANAIGEAMGIALTIGSASQHLGRALAARGATLLVLDGLDAIVEVAGPLIARWLADAPGLRVLATSRVALSIGAELRVELGPLGTEAAASLLRARAARLGAPLGENATDDLRALAARVDGIPLALELAASRLPLLGAAKLRERLEHGLGVLSPHGGRAPTLRGVVRTSVDALGEIERRAFLRCAAFRGGFDLDAAERVLDVPQGHETIDVVQSLRDRSLVASTLAADGTLRLRVYDALREHADEVWDEDDRAATYARHAANYLEQGERWAGLAEGTTAPHGMARLVAERANLLAVLERRRDVAPVEAVRAALVLDRVLFDHGPAHAHLVMLEGAIERARRLGEHAMALRATIRLALARQFEGPEVTPAILAKARDEARALGLEEIEAEAALRQCTQEAYGAPEATLRALDALGPLLARVERPGFRMIEASARGFATSHRAEALTHLERALRIARELGDHRVAGFLGMHIGGWHARHGRLEDAARAWREGAAANHEAHHRRIGAFVEGLAAAATDACATTIEEGVAARGALRRSVDTLAEIGDRRFETMMRVVSVAAQVRAGERDGLEDEVRAVRETARAIGGAFEVGVVLLLDAALGVEARARLDAIRASARLANEFEELSRLVHPAQPPLPLEH